MQNNNRDVIEINVVELFFYLVRRWYLFLAAMLLTGAVGMGICLFVITPKYESTTKIIILNQQTTGTLTYSDMQMSSQLTKDYEALIVSRDVLEPVIRECGLEDDYKELSKRVEVENMTDTRILSITVEDPSPEMAQKIAASIRETAAKHIRAVTDVEAVNVAEEANLPDEPSSPSKMIWAVVSVLLGFLIVFVVLIVQFLADDTIKSSDDIKKYLNLSTLAMIPKMETSAAGKSSREKRKSGAGNRKKKRVSGGIKPEGHEIR